MVKYIKNVTKANEQVINIIPGLIDLIINATMNNANNENTGINFFPFIFLKLENIKIKSIIIKITLATTKLVAAGP